MVKKICVAGAGNWGKNHVKTLHSLGCLAGVVEPDEKRLAEIREAYPGVKLFHDIHEAVKEDFDGFTVAAPAKSHFQVAELILNRRKPVLVEKPLALTVADAKRLAGLADKMGVSLMVGHVLLFHPAIQTIKELIQSGKIGKLQYIYSNRLNLGMVRTEENILWSFAPHDIAIFQYLIGEKPMEIVSRGGVFLQPAIHDSTMTVLTYPGNVVGHIFVSWLHPFKEHRIVAIGSKGMLSYEDSSEEKNLLFYEKSIDWIQGEPIKREGATAIIPYERKMPLTEEMKYFLGHIDGPPPEISNGKNGVEVLEILEKATESLLSGGAARVEKKKEADYYVHPSSYIDDNVEIGEGTKIWHFSHVQSHSRIGKRCVLGQNVNVGNNVVIGDYVKIQNNVSIYEGVELEDYVFCGPSMVFTNILDPRSKYPQKGSQFYLKTLVKEGASIGANATIVCGHTLGRHAFIAAGAVVTKDVPDYALMAGIPARRIGWACECGEILPKFDNASVCPRCGLKYALREDRLFPAS
ncbi:MAG: Gfo/Idh/MocA family oxidoreductase [Candidatus Omnitrophota bacterium]